MDPDAPYFILLCLTLDNFTRQEESAASQWVLNETRRLRRRSHWPFNRRWCVRIEQLVEQCELHLHDNRCKMSMSP